MTAKRILLALTSHDDLGGVRKTGFYVPEAAHPYAVFAGHGFGVDFVSPKGGTPPMDGFDPGDAAQVAFLEDPEVRRKLAATPRPEAIDPGDYDAILYVGGHGTMWDFPDDARLARIGAAIYEQGGVVAAVCHGPAGLVNLTLADGTPLVAGKEVAAFTDDEERAVGLAEVVPFLLQSRLVELGARHTKAPNFEAHVVAHGRLVTGQNPASATGVAEQMVRTRAAGVRR